MAFAVRRSIVFACVVIAACSPNTPTGPPTEVTPEAPSATPSAYQQMVIDAPGSVVPAPDGRVLVATQGDDQTLTLFDTSGQTIARVRTALESPLHVRWMSDSSSALIWGGAGPASPLLVVDGSGRLTDPGLPSDDAGASPDGAWIASTRSDHSSAEVDISTRDGRTRRTLATGRAVHFLGWLGDRVAFASTSGIDLVGVEPGELPKLIIAARDLPESVNELRPPAGGPTAAPDGRVTIVGDSQERYYLLTRTSMRPVPASAALGSDSVFWLGQHDILATTDDGMLEVMDPVTMSVSGKTECGPVDSVEAAVGDLAAFRAGGGIGICDLTSGRATDLGSPPVSGRVYAFGDRFLLHGSGATYVIKAPVH